MHKKIPIEFDTNSIFIRSAYECMCECIDVVFTPHMISGNRIIIIVLVLPSHCIQAEDRNVQLDERFMNV